MIKAKSNPPLVSAHGGHSGRFCNHAEDSLEEIIGTYIARGFSWVGITEHMAPVEDRFVYPDERAAGLDAAALQARFRSYFETCHLLKEKYREQIEIFVGFETETYSGSEAFIRSIVTEFAPAYMVGSLHHVNGMEIDTSAQAYQEAASSVGGLDNLYCRYFDAQYDMVQALNPPIVGHFDLVRIFDPDYKSRLQQPQIAERVQRNLDLIKERDLILDFNLAGFDKLAGEQYPSRDILAAAIKREIALVPGDDSHGIQTVGRHFERGMALLEELGGSLAWKKPAWKKAV
jgi:histidinol-phosphatase (PHP family)